MLHEHLTRQIIGGAMRVHSGLGAGFLESVYRKALVYELGEMGLEALPEMALQVVYRGQVVGDFYADLVVEGLVIVEVKAVVATAISHEVQLVNYLTASGLDVGLLLNFGTPRLQYRRKQRTIYSDPVILSNSPS